MGISLSRLDLYLFIIDRSNSAMLLQPLSAIAFLGWQGNTTITKANKRKQIDLML